MVNGSSRVWGDPNKVSKRRNTPEYYNLYSGKTGNHPNKRRSKRRSTGDNEACNNSTNMSLMSNTRHRGRKRGRRLLYTRFRSDPDPWNGSPPRTPPSSDSEEEDDDDAFNGSNMYSSCKRNVPNMPQMMRGSVGYNGMKLDKRTSQASARRNDTMSSAGYAPSPYLHHNRSFRAAEKGYNRGKKSMNRNQGISNKENVPYMSAMSPVSSADSSMISNDMSLTSNVNVDMDMDMMTAKFQQQIEHIQQHQVLSPRNKNVRRREGVRRVTHNKRDNSNKSKALRSKNKRKKRGNSRNNNDSITNSSVSNFSDSSTNKKNLNNLSAGATLLSLSANRSPPLTTIPGPTAQAPLNNCHSSRVSKSNTHSHSTVAPVPRQAPIQDKALYYDGKRDKREMKNVNFNINSHVRKSLARNEREKGRGEEERIEREKEKQQHLSRGGLHRESEPKGKGDERIRSSGHGSSQSVRLRMETDSETSNFVYDRYIQDHNESSVQRHYSPRSQSNEASTAFPQDALRRGFQVPLETDTTDNNQALVSEDTYRYPEVNERSTAGDASTSKTSKNEREEAVCEMTGDVSPHASSRSSSGSAGDISYRIQLAHDDKPLREDEIDMSSIPDFFFGIPRIDEAEKIFSDLTPLTNPLDIVSILQSKESPLRKGGKDNGSTQTSTDSCNSSHSFVEENDDFIDPFVTPIHTLKNRDKSLEMSSTTATNTSNPSNTAACSSSNSISEDSHENSKENEEEEEAFVGNAFNVHSIPMVALWNNSHEVQSDNGPNDPHVINMKDLAAQILNEDVSQSPQINSDMTAHLNNRNTAINQISQQPNYCYPPNVFAGAQAFGGMEANHGLTCAPKFHMNMYSHTQKPLQETDAQRTLGGLLMHGLAIAPLLSNRRF